MTYTLTSYKNDETQREFHTSHHADEAEAREVLAHEITGFLEVGIPDLGIEPGSTLFIIRDEAGVEIKREVV